MYFVLKVIDLNKNKTTKIITQSDNFIERKLKPQ